MSHSIITKGDTAMKMFYEDPTVEVMLLDVADVITTSAWEDDYTPKPNLPDLD